MLFLISLELAEAITNAIVAKLEEREKAKKDAAIVVISSATQSKGKSLFRAVGFHSSVYDGPAISAPTVSFTAFDWGHREKDAALPDARNHIENELQKFGVRMGRGGYAVKDVHLNKNLLDMQDENIGAITGGSDIAVVPYKTANFIISACICVLLEVVTARSQTL